MLCTRFFYGPHCIDSLCGPQHTQTSINWCVWFICCKTQQKTMNTYLVDSNIKLATIYYNGGKLNPFKVRLDVTLSELKGRSNQINRQLNHKDTRMVNDVEYRCSSTNSEGSVQFTHMKLKNDDNRTIFSTHGPYITKRPIEFDGSLVRFFEDIQKSLI